MGHWWQKIPRKPKDWNVLTGGMEADGVEVIQPGEFIQSLAKAVKISIQDPDGASQEPRCVTV